MAPDTPHAVREQEIDGIKARLHEAMEEIRSICSGLVLPHIEATDLPDLLERVVSAHRQRTGADVGLTVSAEPRPLAHSAKICIYRFVQEALNNGFRHGKGLGQKVWQGFDGAAIVVEVEDKGPGFDVDSTRSEGLGLAGLRERIESLGGSYAIESSPEGTRLRMTINAEEVEQTS